MSSMNLFNIKKELNNLNIVIDNLKTENSNLKQKIDELNEEIIDIQIKKPNLIEITDFISSIKDEFNTLSTKVDIIEKKRFFKEVLTIEKYDEVQNFLTKLNIDINTKNLINFLDYKTINKLTQLNIEELEIYGIPKKTSELIVKKACEKLNIFIV